jgi:hypothetical protein
MKPSTTHCGKSGSVPNHFLGQQTWAWMTSIHAWEETTAWLLEYEARPLSDHEVHSHMQSYLVGALLFPVLLLHEQCLRFASSALVYARVVNNLDQQGAAGKCDFCHFFGAPTSKNNEKSISRIIDFCLSSTFLRDFYRVRKIDWTFD